MPNWSLKQISNQRVLRQSKKQASETKWRKVEIIHAETTPSWKRFGKGCASLSVEAVVNCDGIPTIQLVTAETSLADPIMGDKRDVTKQTHFTAYGPAALEIYEILREVFEPQAAKPTADAA